MNSFECRPVENIAIIKARNDYESLLFARLIMKEDEMETTKIGLDLIRKRRNSPCTNQFSNDADRLTYNEDPQTILQNMPEEFNELTILIPCQNDEDFSGWGG